GPIPYSGTGFTMEEVAIGTSPTVFNSSEPSFSRARFSADRYNAGAIGTPYIFFACPDKMLKDNGTLESGDGSGDGSTKLQRWGIIPPTYPAFALHDAIIILPDTEIISGSGRINTTVSSVGGEAPGNVTISPADMSGILEGMLLNVGGQLGIVELAGPGSFQIYLLVLPTVGTSITSGQATVTPSAIPGTVTQYTLSSTVDAAFDGIPQDGYDTDDFVHVAIGIADPANVAD